MTRKGSPPERVKPKPRGRGEKLEATSGWELGLCSMVNVSKSLLNVVSGNQAKVADKPEPKGVQSDVLL